MKILALFQQNPSKSHFSKKIPFMNGKDFKEYTLYFEEKHIPPMFEIRMVHVEKKSDSAKYHPGTKGHYQNTWYFENILAMHGICTKTWAKKDLSKIQLAFLTKTFFPSSIESLRKTYRVRFCENTGFISTKPFQKSFLKKNSIHEWERFQRIHPVFRRKTYPTHV